MKYAADRETSKYAILSGWHYFIIILKISVKDVQKRWKNMRDTYIKELRYERKVEQGLAVAKRKKYMYAHLMDFLSPWKKPPINKR